jgi:hypothetical protein
VVQGPQDDLTQLYLSGWPFQTVPDESFSKIWADREQLRHDVIEMVRRWKRTQKSSIHLMWADLGAGKTHTLRYIERLFLEDESAGIIPVYAVMPKYVRSFFEVYQAIITAVDVFKVAQQLSASLADEGARSQIARSLFASVPGAVRAIHVLGIGSEVQKDLAFQWLRGERGLARRQIEPLGLIGRIHTSDEGVAILSGIVRLLGAAGVCRRVLIMFDECQRFGNFRESIGRDINTSLQTWYDASPNGLTLVLSFGSGEERFVRHLLSPELLSRVDPQRLSLDLLTAEQALQFVGDLLDHYRLPGASGRYYPLSNETATAVTVRLARDGGITPRLLMHVFNALFSQADFALSDGQPLELDPARAVERAENVLAELRAQPVE